VIRGSTGRFLTLVLAPLLVVGVTAIVMLSRGGDEKIKVSADGPTVTILTPDADAHMAQGSIVVQADVNDPDGLASAELRVDGKRVAKANLNGGSDEQADFTWDANDTGQHDLAVRARDLNGSWGAAADIKVTVDSSDVALPAPPTSGPTTAGAATSPTQAATLPPDTGTVPGVPPETAATTSAGATSTLLPPLFPVRTVPPATAPPAFGTQPPATLPATQPPTQPGIVTTPTLPTTPPTVATTPPPTTIPPCRVGTPVIITPQTGAIEVASPVLVTWALAAPCPPRAQELQVVASSRNVWQQPVKPVNARIALSGNLRAYLLGIPLPACTTVRISLLSYDLSSPGFHRSATKSFTTTSAGCVLPPTTTTTTTTTVVDTTTTVDTTPTTLPPPPPVT